MNHPGRLFLLLLLARPCPAQAPPANPAPSFDVASVRLSPPDHGFTTVSPPGAAELRLTTVSMQFLLCMAFDINADQTLNLPGWATTTLYDVTARAPGYAGLTYQQSLPYLQNLLHDRFGLQSHFENRERSGYALVLARGGAKLKPASELATETATASIFAEGLRGTSIPLKTFAGMLRTPVGSPVVDETGLPGSYDITLTFSNPNSSPADTPTDPTLPSLFTALTEQLGLRLIPRKITLPYLVIDHVDRVPTPN